MTYAVHLFPRVRVRVIGVEADSTAAAMTKVEETIDFHQLLDRPGIFKLDAGLTITDVEYQDDESPFALVDVLLEDGEVDYGNTAWLRADGSPMVDGKSLEEEKAARCDLATTFWAELLDAHETLGGIADQHGAETLADLMYLHAAILTGGKIASFPDFTGTATVVSQLPSAEKWMAFIEAERVGA